MTPKRIVFFDGYCNLCNHFLDFLIRFDGKRNLHFASLQGSSAQSVLTEEERTRYDSLIFWEEGRVTFKSYAALRAIAALGGLWKGILLFRIVPNAFLDYLYDLTARNRLTWFGKREACRIPSEEEKNYLLP